MSHAPGQCKARLLPVAGCEQGPCSSTVETVQWEGARGRLAPGPALHPDHSAPRLPAAARGCRSTLTVMGRRREGEAEGPAGLPLPAALHPRRLAEQACRVGPQMRPGRGWRSPCWPRVQGAGQAPDAPDPDPSSGWLPGLGWGPVVGRRPHPRRPRGRGPRAGPREVPGRESRPGGVAGPWRPPGQRARCEGPPSAPAGGAPAVSLLPTQE